MDDDSEDALDSFIRIQESFSINFAELNGLKNNKNHRDKSYSETSSSDSNSFDIIPLTRHYSQEINLQKKNKKSNSAIEEYRSIAEEKRLSSSLIKSTQNLLSINSRSNKAKHKSNIYVQRMKKLQNEFECLETLRKHYTMLEDEYEDLSKSYSNFRMFDYQKAIKSLDKSCNKSRTIIKKLTKISNDNKILYKERNQKIADLTESINFLNESFSQDCNSSLFEINETMKMASDEDTTLNNLVKVRGRLRADNNALLAAIARYRSEKKEKKIQIEVANERQSLLELDLNSTCDEMERISLVMKEIIERNSFAHETKQSIKKLERMVEEIKNEKNNEEQALNEELSRIDLFNQQTNAINLVLKIYNTIESRIQEAIQLEKKEMKLSRRNNNIEGELNAFKACLQAGYADTRAEIQQIVNENTKLKNLIKESQNTIVHLKEEIEETKIKIEQKKVIPNVFVDSSDDKKYRIEDANIILDSAIAQRRMRKSKLEKLLNDLPNKLETAKRHLKARKVTIQKKTRVMKDEQLQLAILRDETHGDKWYAAALLLFALRRSLSTEFPFWSDNTPKAPEYYSGLVRRWALTLDKLSKYVN